MVEVRTKFSLSSGKLLRVLINNRFEENLISARLVEKILRNESDRIYCEYFEDYFGYQFTMGHYEGNVECHVSLEDCGVIFGKPQITKRSATYDTEIDILQLFSCGLWQSCYMTATTHSKGFVYSRKNYIKEKAFFQTMNQLNQLLILMNHHSRQRLKPRRSTRQTMYPSGAIIQEELGQEKDLRSATVHTRPPCYVLNHTYRLYCGFQRESSQGSVRETVDF